MKIGPWYDPIERRWHKPREVVPEPANPYDVYESDEDKGRRKARENAIWAATTATAVATQQGDQGEQ